MTVPRILSVSIYYEIKVGLAAFKAGKHKFHLGHETFQIFGKAERVMVKYTTEILRFYHECFISIYVFLLGTIVKLVIRYLVA